MNRPNNRTRIRTFGSTFGSTVVGSVVSSVGGAAGSAARSSVGTAAGGAARSSVGSAAGRAPGGSAGGAVGRATGRAARGAVRASTAWRTTVIPKILNVARLAVTHVAHQQIGQMIHLLLKGILVLQKAVPASIGLLDPRAGVVAVPELIRIVPRLVLIDVHVHPVDTDVRPQVQAQIDVVVVPGSLTIHEHGIIGRPIVLALLSVVDRLGEPRLHHCRQQSVDLLL